jgi:hypothetical protein
MSIHTPVSAGNVTVGGEILAWAKDYLTKEHAYLNRPYQPSAVCPYVEASLKANSLNLVFHDEFDGRDEDAISDQILKYALPFKEAPPAALNEQILNALLIVFPKIKPELYAVLDECHRKIKPSMVEFGLMIGQFHPQCRERAIHNEKWNSISNSPVPLMAVRHMTLHDIMFLGDNRQTFMAYESRFGFSFAQSENLSRGYQKYLVSYYERARAKYLTNADEKDA